MITAYSYKRFSNAKQEKGDSARRQTDGTPELCKRKGWHLDTTLDLFDRGVSAFKGKHAKVGALSRFLAAIEKGIVTPGSVLIVENLDRLSREQISDAVAMFLEIINAGVKIALPSKYDSTCKEFTKASINENQFDLMWAVGEFARANGESERKSKLISEAYKGKRLKLARGEKPLMGRWPRWLDRAGDGYVINPERGKVIRSIVAMAMNGIGAHKITRTLNETGCKPFGDADVKAWTRCTVQSVLRSKCLFGEYQPHKLTESGKVPVGDPVPNYYPALITAEEWYALQAVLNTRKSARGPVGKRITNLFGAKLVHGQSGERIVLCQKKRKEDAEPTSMMVTESMIDGRLERCGFDYDVFERHFLSWVSEVSLSKAKKADKTDFIAGQIAEAKGKIDLLQNRLASGGDFAAGLTLLETLDKQVRDLQAQLEEAKATKSKPKLDTGAVVEILSQLDGTSGEKRYELRSRLRLAIADVVTQVRAYTYGRMNGVRVAIVVVILADGVRRVFEIAYDRTRQKSNQLIYTKIAADLVQVVQGEPLAKELHAANKLAEMIMTDPSWFFVPTKTIAKTA